MRSSQSSEGEPHPRKLLKVKQLVEDIDRLHSKVNVMATAFLHPLIAEESGDIKYIDEQRTICLVSAKYLEKLNNTINDMKHTGLSLNQSLKSLTIQNEQLKREVQLHHQKAATAQQQLQQAEEINSMLEKDIKNTNIRVVQDAALLASIFDKEHIIKIDHIPVEDNILRKQIDSSSTQTQYWAPMLQLNTKSQNNIHAKQKEPQSQMQQRMDELLTSYESQLQGLVNTISSKLENVSGQHFDVKEWLMKNQLLKEENEELKNRMAAIQLEKAKVLLWREEVENKMREIEKDINAPLPTMTVSSIAAEALQDKTSLQVENFYLRNQLTNVRNQLLQKQLHTNNGWQSQNQLRELFSEESKDKEPTNSQEHLEDNAINKIVGLSQKIKAVVKWIVDIV